jgi:(1->4)-alpha-D-glucan 1-alpha-D-glucosylmutase
MRVPLSTYRLQFCPSFGFKEAREILSYLKSLGITDLYASPIFASSAGSQHGYNIVDPNRLNPDLGKAEDFDLLVHASQNYGLGWVQDIVPNHMAYDGANPMLMDVFENGPASKYYNFFDIDWQHPDEGLKGRVLTPALEKLYRESLEDGKIQLKFNVAGFSIQYCHLSFPVKVESYADILGNHLNDLEEQRGKESPVIGKLRGVVDQLIKLKSIETDERNEQIVWIKSQLWDLFINDRKIKQFINNTIDKFNGIKGQSETFNLLDKLLSEQIFRLSFWKVATAEINYRRFFTINELICLRIEDEAVFNYTHSMIFRLVKEGKFTGLRIDHIDGLYDPAGYLKRLRDKIGDGYILVEKVLARNESLRSSWPVQGTTGYDFLNYVNGLFCDPSNKKSINRIYFQFTGFRSGYSDLVSEKKRLMVERYMTGDMDNLARLLKRISSTDRYGSDFTIYRLKRAIIELIAGFSVYRTYISQEKLSEVDRFYIMSAVESAYHRSPDLAEELRFLEKVFLKEYRDELPAQEKDLWVHFVMRFQQLTGPLMAKGLEDTALYVYNRLLSLNEVGGDPHTFGTSPHEWHEFNIERALNWPDSMNATSTHDVKRGEDTRARIQVLSEIPEEWKRQLHRWAKLNRLRKDIVQQRKVPAKNDEYFLYQTLLGVLPFSWKKNEDFLARIKEHMIKVLREAKVHTGWIDPDEKYEEAVLKFIDEILTPSNRNQFLKEFLTFQRKVAYYGIFNSLSQTLLKITATGVPDFYQGTELWDLTLVDPDNRRPVDFKARKRFLKNIEIKIKLDILKLIAELWSSREDGRIKLFLIYRALRSRIQHQELFQRGQYLPIAIEGRWKDCVLAFGRRHRNRWAMTIVPRFLTSIIKEEESPLTRKIWMDTRLTLLSGAPRTWRNVITSEIVTRGNALPVGDILTSFPVALLVSEDAR